MGAQGMSPQGEAQAGEMGLTQDLAGSPVSVCLPANQLRHTRFWNSPEFHAGSDQPEADKTAGRMKFCNVVSAPGQKPQFS